MKTWILTEKGLMWMKRPLDSFKRGESDETDEV
jgi:hypothetical protein